MCILFRFVAFILRKEKRNRHELGSAPFSLIAYRVLFLKISFAGLGALGVRQALFSKIFGNFSVFWPFFGGKGALRALFFSHPKGALFLTPILGSRFSEGGGQGGAG